MENSKPFATPARYSHQSVYPTPSSTTQVKSNDSSHISSSNVKTIVESVTYSKDHLLPPPFGIHKIAGNVPKDIDITSQQDPFLNVPGDDKKKKGSVKKLSAMAVPFQPRQASNSVSVFQGVQNNKNNHNSQLSKLPFSSTTFRSFKHSESTRTVPMEDGIFEYVYPTGEFASGRHTRYLSIEGISESLSLTSIKELIKSPKYGAPSSVFRSRDEPSKVFISFSNIVDSVNAAGEIPNQYSSWSLDFITAREFAEGLGTGSGLYHSIHRGQLLVTVTQHVSVEEVSELEAMEYVEEAIKEFGLVLAWEVRCCSFPTIKIHMEYYDLRVSERARTMLDGRIFGTLELSVKNYAPDVHAYPNSVQQDFLVVPAATFEDDLNTMVDALTYDSSGSNVPRVIRNPFGYVNTPYSDVSTATNLPVTGNGYPLSNTRPMSGFLPLSVAYPPLDRHLFLPGHNINTYRPLIRPEFPATALRLPYRGRRNSRMNIIGGNNVVNVFRITHGQDVRTTIMLRNIPNKMPQSELKQLIDETNFGEYDFMYLRIDFANNCNVGYAFVNFVDPLAIVKFVRVRAGNRWARYNSDKVAEISYATIQGRDCLIQKFRNSSVMLEDPSFRPKLFHVSPGPLAGMEDLFPHPDNDSKLRRSVENAGAVGLFAPRAGQVFRESQRRRRSQFDRGTNLAQIEESSFIGENEGAMIGTAMGSQSAPHRHVRF